MSGDDNDLADQGLKVLHDVIMYMYVLDLVLVMTLNDFACQLLDSGDRITILQHDIKISLPYFIICQVSDSRLLWQEPLA